MFYTSIQANFEEKNSFDSKFWKQIFFWLLPIFKIYFYIISFHLKANFENKNFFFDVLPKNSLLHYFFPPE